MQRFSDSGNIVDSAVISMGDTILKGIQILNEANAQILLVTDGDGRLVGTVTDGDIRRAIYVGVPMSNPIHEICNRDFKSLKLHDKDAALAIYEEYGIRRIPVVDDSGRAVDIIFIEDVLSKYDLMPAVNKVVVMAGGRGSRLDPITRVVPKPLLPIGDRPILELIMNSFYNQGYEGFILSVNYKKDFIKSYFAERELPYGIEYMEEPGFMGTAGSLALMTDFLKDTFFLTNCDILVEMNYRSAYREHVKQGNAITVVGVLKNFNIPYGVIKIEDGKFASIDEKPDLHYIVNAGIYIVEPNCLKLVKAEDKPDGLYHMTHLIEDAVSNGMKVGVFPAHRKWVDIGQWSEYNKLL
jgi:dTDP-glucose pyrophosphorylase/CBS domain-containing protein